MGALLGKFVGLIVMGAFFLGDLVGLGDGWKVGVGVGLEVTGEVLGEDVGVGVGLEVKLRQ